jgi:hypothetical protein
MTALQRWGRVGTGTAVRYGENPEKEWAVDEIHGQCPDRTITGVVVSPVFYLPPLTAERSFDVTYVYDDDVNDGWDTFARGTRSSWTMRLRPEG